MPRKLSPYADPKMRKKVAELYAMGLRTAALKERFSWLSNTGLKNILDEHGVEPRKTGERLGFGLPPW